MKSKKKWLLLSVAILFLAGFLYLTKSYNLASLLPAPVRQIIPMYPTKSYPSIKAALQNANYSKYPTFPLFIPIQGMYNSMQYNPKTNTQLELDTSEGGGYACCEAPTFYVWVDRKDNIFWIKTYQADLMHVNEQWYGPFKLKK